MFVRRSLILSLGILTGWSFFYFGLFLLFLVSQTTLPYPLLRALAPAFTTIIKLQYSILLVPFLLIFYLTHLITKTSLPRRQLTIWTFALFFASVVAMPIYWYLFLWRIPPSAQPTQ